MKKNNSSKLFNKLAKRAYKVSKKRKLGWKWQDAQKWTSANLFQKYKGTKAISKIRLTNIDDNVQGVMDGLIAPVPKAGFVPKSFEVCFNPFDIASSYLDSFEWFEIDDKVSILNDDLKVDLDLEYDGNVFAKTGVIKKLMLPNLVEIRESMRKVTNGSGYFPEISFYIVLIEGREDDRRIACNYFVLITFKDSSISGLLRSKGLIKTQYVTAREMPQDEKARLEETQKIREEERKRISRKQIKQIARPQSVEPKPEPTATEDNKTERLLQYNKAVEKLEQLLEKGLISKKVFAKRFQELGKNLKDGGII